jgi:dihydroorotase
MTRIRITNGRLFDPASDIDLIGDLYITDEKIVAIAEAPDGFTADRTIDAAGMLVIPGIVDLNARLREPGMEQKGTIVSETTAAAAGGITTVICPPDTSPVIDTPADAELIRRRAKQSAQARVLTVGALTMGLEGEQLTEMSSLQISGCVAVSNARQPVRNNLVYRRAMEYAATWDLPIFVQACDHSLANMGCAHEGRVASRLGLPGIPASAETVAVATTLELAQQTGARIHFQTLSCARSIDMIRDARRGGLAVTADVAAHQLHLSEMDVDGFNGNCHVIPPLRTQEDRDGLRMALADGTLDAICSSHEPHEPDAKLAPFPATEPGISGIETLLPLTLRLVEEKVIDLQRAIELLTSGPARIAGLPYSRLKTGTEADICLIAPEEEWELSAAGLHSNGQNTPFDGWTFRGKVMHTLFAGRPTYFTVPDQ